MKALSVARYLLFLAKVEDSGDTISNLKMQKLLYYAQGEALGLFKAPLFDDVIEAWKHGPVVRSVYTAFKKYQKDSISFAELDSFNPDELSPKEHEFLLLIFRKYGSKAAWELRNMTHAESPWQSSYTPLASKTIPLSVIRECFSEKLDAEIATLTEEKERDEEIRAYGFL